jgi:hypothetical protein
MYPLLGILSFFFCVFSSFCNGYQYQLSCCAIFQNEAPYFKEWIEFHRLVGVEKFYLYNNESDDNYMEVLDPYVKKGIVEIIDWPGEVKYRQSPAFDDAIKRAQGITKWLMMIDLDEFCFPVECKSLVLFLKDYEEFGGVCVNWQMYGTGHVAKVKPKELMIEKLCLKAPVDYSENIHVKSIVRPETVDYCKSPHFCFYKPGFTQVNADKQPFNGPFSPFVSIDKIRINHYFFRDHDFYLNVKLKRRIKWGDEVEWLYKRMEIFNSVPDNERAIFKYLHKLKKTVKKRKVK